MGSVAPTAIRSGRAGDWVLFPREQDGSTSASTIVAKTGVENRAGPSSMDPDCRVLPARMKVFTSGPATSPLHGADGEAGDEAVDEEVVKDGDGHTRDQAGGHE